MMHLNLYLGHKKVHGNME